MPHAPADVESRPRTATPIFITDTIPSLADASAPTSTKDVSITTSNSEVTQTVVLT